MSRPPRLNILIVPSDGSRPLRFHLPRWVIYAVLIASTAGVSTLGALVGDYARARSLSRDPAALHQQVAAQQALIEAFQARLGEIRLEVATWRDLNAKIWEPFGPDIAPAQRTRGIGGASPAAASERSGVRPSSLEELDRLAETVDEEGQNLRALERLMGRAGKALALMPSSWPVRGAVNSDFGARSSPWTRASEFHSGLDIAADRGTPVHAPAPGTVIFASVQNEFGLTVMIEHGHDIRTLYGHLSKVQVAPGQRIERGQVVGFTGNSGKSSGPHLHYEILVKGQSVNPRAYLWD